MATRPFTFRARLEQVPGGGPFFVTIPARVSKAIGRRGNVPVIATVNGVAEVRASITPCGGGRHRLRLNATTRAEAGVAVDDRLDVTLAVDEHPVAAPLPADLAAALREVDALAGFETLPVGKRNHIVGWIEKAAKEATRAKRVALVIESALRAREKSVERGRPHG